MKRILIIVREIDGGTGTFLNSFSKLQKFFVLQVLVLGKPSYRKTILFNPIYFQQKSYASRYTFRFSTIVGFMKEVLWYLREVKTFSPDIILSIDIHANILTFIIKQLFRKSKIILSTHNNIFEAINNKSDIFLRLVLRPIIRFAYSHADILVSVSQEEAEDMKDILGIKKEIQTIYNGNYLPIAKPRIKSRNNIIISVGRLVGQKDFFTLIDAFRLVLKEIKNAKLWIVGDGYLKPRLAAYAKHLKVEKSVTFFGWQENITNLLKKSDVFVLATNREGFPYVVLESMSQGLPVIASNVDYGPSEMLGNGKYGILISPRKIPVLKKKIIGYLESGLLYHKFSEKGLRQVKKFSEDSMLAAYRRLIGSM